MYRATAEIVFRAGHSLMLRGGGREELHEHDWRVRATVARDELNAEGLVIDFRLLKRRLDQTVAGLEGLADLGQAAELAGVNASAEVLAKLIHDRLQASLPGDVRLVEVRVWETQECWASYQARDD